MTKTRILSFLFALLVFVGVFAMAQPARNVGAGHPNLKAAQRLSAQAYQKIIDAQKANEWDMQGHAQKAKDLLDQVNNELKLAAEAANKNGK
jgi:protein involved in temperature-dependent protein secretion